MALRFQSVRYLPVFLNGTQTCLLLTDRQVAERSLLIKNMMDDLGDSAASTEVPIPNVSCHCQDHIAMPSINVIRATGQRICPQESHRMVRAPQERPSRRRRRRLRLAKEDHRHRRVGPEVHASRPGDAF